MSMLRSTAAAGTLAFMATGAFAGPIPWNGAHSAVADLPLAAAFENRSRGKAQAASPAAARADGQAWCLDLMRTLKSKGDAAVMEAPEAPGANGRQLPAQALQNGNPPAHAARSAAFQGALWEGLDDSRGFSRGPGNLLLNRGGTKAAPQAHDAIARNRNPAAPGFPQTLPEGATNFPPAQDPAAPAGVMPIPLPAAGWLLLGGLGALAAVRRRRHAA